MSLVPFGMERKKKKKTVSSFAFSKVQAFIFLRRVQVVHVTVTNNKKYICIYKSRNIYRHLISI